MVYNNLVATGFFNEIARDLGTGPTIIGFGVIALLIYSIVKGGGSGNRNGRNGYNNYNQNGYNNQNPNVYNDNNQNGNYNGMNYVGRDQFGNHLTQDDVDRRNIQYQNNNSENGGRY